MHHTAQRGAVRRARGVVSYAVRDYIVAERVVQSCEQLRQFLGGKQVEQHQYIGLFRQLISIGAVILRLEDKIEALDIAVAPPIIPPVELAQRIIAFELTDDPVVMKRHVRSAADVTPSRDFVRRYTKPLRQF